MPSKIKSRAIADDILNVIKNDGQGGYVSYGYLQFEGLKNVVQWNENDEFQSYVDKIRPYCEACALASCFLSLVKLYDDVKVKEVVNKLTFTRLNIPTNFLLDKLEKVFGKEQIKLIEIAYEIDENMQYEVDKDGFDVRTDNVTTPIQTLLKNTRLPKEEVKRAKKFGRRYEYGPKRLAGIMRNVKKNGYFKP